MDTLRPAPDAEPARWLLAADVDWMTLVRYGPPGFDTYVRIAFKQEEPWDEAKWAQGLWVEQWNDPTMLTALATLSAFTTTPERAYAAIWEGWIATDRLPTAPWVNIPNRRMLLFAGPVAAMRNAPSLAWFGTEDGSAEPHLVWPEDRAWCLACEVDEEIEFSVGCSTVAAEALARALPRQTRSLAYGEDAPMYRDQ